MFTWWDRLPAGIGRGGHGSIVLRTRYLAAQGGPHVIGAGGVGRLTLTVNGIEVAAGRTDVPADPVEAMVRPGEIRATVDLAAGREAEIGVCLRPDDWPQGPVAIRLGLVPAPDDDAMLSEAAETDCPVLHAVPEAGRLEYREGLLTGYRGYDRAGTEPRFPFGHGLGYTTWAYQSAVADSPVLAPGDDLGVTVVVRNTGPRTGREVVQAYLEPPAADPGRPVRTLAAFTSDTAAPGEHAAATLTVPARAFDRYDEAAGGWVRPSGEFTVRIGRSSADLPLQLRVKSW
jgi:hypothetical protein